MYWYIEVGSLRGLYQNTFIAASGAIKTTLRPSSIKNKLGQMEMLFLQSDSYPARVRRGFVLALAVHAW